MRPEAASGGLIRIDPNKKALARGWIYEALPRASAD
jgi:hypothetical protein